MLVQTGSTRRFIQNIFIACIFGACFLLASSADASTTPNLWVEDGITLSSYSGFQIDAIENSTGRELARNISELLRSHLQEHLKRPELSLPQDQKTDITILRVKSVIAFYQGGSALERWVGLFGPRAASVSVVRVMLVDAKTNALVGDMVVIGNIEFGLAGRPGGETAVLEDVAESAARAIKNRISEEQANS